MIMTPVTWTRIAGDRQIEIGIGRRGSTKVAVCAIGRRRRGVEDRRTAAALYVKVSQLEGGGGGNLEHMKAEEKTKVSGHPSTAKHMFKF